LILLVGKSAPDWLVSPELPPGHIGILKGILASCLEGLLRDLQRAERLPDAYATRRESAACTRLLSGLDRGVIAGPDEDACETLRQLLVTADEANGYAIAVAEHDALHGLLVRLGSRNADEP
jgi:hypothetical protein